MHSVAQSNLKLAMTLLPQPSGTRSMCLCAWQGAPHCVMTGVAPPTQDSSYIVTTLGSIVVLSWVLGVTSYGCGMVGSQAPSLHDSPLQGGRMAVSLQLWEEKQASKSTFATPSRYSAQ